MLRQVTRREIVVLLGSIGAIGAVTASLRAVPNVSPTTAALALLLVVLGAATLARLETAIAVSLLAMLAPQLLLSPACRHIHDRRSAELDCAVRVSRRRRHRQQAVGGRARARPRRDRPAQRGDPSLRSHARRPADHGDGRRDRGARPPRGAPVRADARGDLPPGDHGWRMYQGGSEEVRVDADVLEHRARRRAARWSSMRTSARTAVTSASATASGVLILRCATGPSAIGLLAAAAPAIDVGTLDAVAGVVAIAIERTQFLGEREAAELVRQKAELAATLLASLSHDLKTPLTAITGRGRKPARRPSRATTDAHRPAQRSSSSNASLGCSRTSWTWRVSTPRRSRSNVNGSRRLTWSTRRPPTSGTRWRAIRCSVDADAEAEVEIDPRVASVALSHLLENAAQYSPAGPGDRVSTRAQTADGSAYRSPTTVPGLDPGELDHVFERFFRGRAARHLSPGTGMGLAITRGLLPPPRARVGRECTGSGRAVHDRRAGPDAPARDEH